MTPSPHSTAHRIRRDDRRNHPQAGAVPLLTADPDGLMWKGHRVARWILERDKEGHQVPDPVFNEAYEWFKGLEDQMKRTQGKAD